MTREEFYSRLLQVGMGWLGWTERETLRTTIPAIELAYEGLTEKLFAVQVEAFERPKPKAVKTDNRPTSRQIFDVIGLASKKNGGRRSAIRPERHK